MIQFVRELFDNLIIQLGKKEQYPIEINRRKQIRFFREIFFEAEKHIIELMKKNSYPRFIQSEQYRHLLQNAPNPLPKKAYVLSGRNTRVFVCFFLAEYFILSKTHTFVHHRVVAMMNMIPMIQRERKSITIRLVSLYLAMLNPNLNLSLAHS